MLEEQQTVVLGWQMDGRSQHTEFRCSEVQLLKYPLPTEPTDQVQAPQTADSAGQSAPIYYTLGGQRLSTAPDRGVFVVNRNGIKKKIIRL